MNNYPDKYIYQDDRQLIDSNDIIGVSRVKELTPEVLCSFDNHLTHGRPISIETALSHGLKIAKLESDQELQERVLSVFHSAIVTIEITNTVKIIENNKGVGVFTQVQRNNLKVPRP